MLRPMQISSYLILFSCVIYVCAKCELEWDSFVTQVLLPMRNDDAMKREKTPNLKLDLSGLRLDLFEGTCL